MSRLDDELRNAFRRQQPPADFTARVLERVAAQPRPRLSWWRRLAALLEPPAVRWVAIGVTASLLLAIGAAQWARLTPKAGNDTTSVAKTEPPAVEDSNKKPVESAPPDQLVQPQKPAQPERKPRRAPRPPDLATAHPQIDPELRAEGEAAREKLMLALSIASSTLNGAQKAVRDDGPKP